MNAPAGIGMCRRVEMIRYPEIYLSWLSCLLGQTRFLRILATGICISFLYRHVCLGDAFTYIDDWIHQMRGGILCVLIRYNLGSLLRRMGTMPLSSTQTTKLERAKRNKVSSAMRLNTFPIWSSQNFEAKEKTKRKRERGRWQVRVAVLISGLGWWQGK